MVQACLVFGLDAPGSPVEALRLARDWATEVKAAREDRKALQSMKASLEGFIKEFFEGQAVVMQARLNAEYASRFGGSQ